jgi:hypothetical protein
MHARHPLFLGALAVSLVACAPGAATSSPPGAIAATAASPAVPTPPPAATPGIAPAAEPAVAPDAASATTAPAALPAVLVHKSPTCGCCGAWVEHLRGAGFPVTIDERDDLSALKQQLGIPADKASCHTAEVDGLVIEGHVPAEDIKRLLAQRGEARGLVLPGMPVGSPGMESPDGRVQPYTVERLEKDGSTTPFAAHGQAQ